MSKNDEIALYETQHGKRFQFILAQVNKMFPDKSSVRILDFGSHIGTLSFLLKDNGYDVTGIDIPSMVDDFEEEYTKRSITFLPFSGKVPRPDDTYDCVIFSETLEHIQESPVPLLKELRRVLSPSGFLLLTTPNVMRSENKLKFLLGINIHQDLQRFLTSPRFELHAREYTKDEVSTLLRNYAGYRNVKISLSDFASGRTKLRRFIQNLIYIPNLIWSGFRGTIIAIAQK